MEWVYDDGGRADAGFKGSTGDCGARSIAIATSQPYKVVYDLVNEYAARERRLRRKSNARLGLRSTTARRIMADLGWAWVPTMTIGSGTTIHLRDGELPAGRLMVRCSKHYTTVIDGVVHDTFDPTRDGTRAVYGYFIREANMTDTYKIRVSGTVLGWFEGTGAWQRMVGAARDLSCTRQDLAAAARAESQGQHWAKLFIADQAKDRSRTVHLTKDEALDLREYASYLEAAAADDAGPENMEALGELNAARALLRQIDRKLATS